MSDKVTLDQVRRLIGVKGWSNYAQCRPDRGPGWESAKTRALMQGEVHQGFRCGGCSVAKDATKQRNGTHCLASAPRLA